MWFVDSSPSFRHICVELLSEFLVEEPVKISLLPLSVSDVCPTIKSRIFQEFASVGLIHYMKLLWFWAGAAECS